ncbi:MAG: TlpA disulfide reductase family protein [Bacillota bacterium]|nr:TlpA disulfide reductase family protein [Bacillota bacterium]
MKKNVSIALVSVVVLVLVVLGIVSFIKSGKDSSIDTSHVTPLIDSDKNNSVNPSVSASDSDTSTQMPRKLADDFTLTDLNGKQITLSELKGKNVFLNFFTTWCGPCKEELPNVEKIYKDYSSKGLQVYLIDLGEDEDTVKNFLKEKKYTLNTLLDVNNDVGNLYRTTEIPTSLFIDKEGYVVSKCTGKMTYAQMQERVDKLFK